MRNKRVLLIAAGRRYSLVQRLIAHNLDVYAIDRDTYCPIRKICEVIVTPEGSFQAEVDVISQTVKNLNIDIVIPLSDFWAANIDNVDIDHNKIVGNSAVGQICYDKLLFEIFMNDLKQLCNVHYPYKRLFSNYILKPRFGNGSKGIKICSWYNPYGAFVSPVAKNGISSQYICQRYIRGPEYSVDAYFDKKGKFINCVCRSRDRVDGGEVVNSTMLPHNSRLHMLLAYHTQIIGDALSKYAIQYHLLPEYSHVGGPMCFQYIYDEKNDIPYIIEVNARFGGGCILSLECGLDMIQMIIDEYINDKDVSHWKYKPLTPMAMKRVFYETFYYCM